MTAADHQERIGVMEERAARHKARRSLASVNEIGIDLVRPRRLPESKDTVLAVKDDLGSSRDEIGDQCRQADAKIHVGTVAKILRRPPGDLPTREWLHRLPPSSTTRSTKMPGVTTFSGSIVPSGTISRTWTMLRLAAIAIVGLKLRVDLR